MPSTIVSNVRFTCPNCLRVMNPPYAPVSAPNCPSCSVKMQPEWTGAPFNVHCPKCDTLARAYQHDRCPKCNGAWFGFTSETTAKHTPQSAFEGTSVRAHHGPTANNLGSKAPPAQR